MPFKYRQLNKDVSELRLVRILPAEDVAPISGATTSPVRDFTSRWIGPASLEHCTWPNPDLPSWTPDWTNKDHFHLFSGRASYHASLAEPAVFHFDGTTRKHLTCQGFTVGAIDGLGASYYESYSSSKEEDNMTQPSSTSKPYGSRAGLRDALWRTLTGNRTPNGRVAPATYACLLDCPLELQNKLPGVTDWRGRRAFEPFMSQNANFVIGGCTLASFFLAEGDQDPGASRDALERVFRFLRSRRMGVTVEGYLCLVPFATKVGDVVVVLMVCNVPMVVRTAGEQ